MSTDTDTPSADIEVPVAGHPKRLFYSPGTHRCGSIHDGVAFRFDGEGCWVISLETLREIVRDEDAARATRPCEPEPPHV